MYSLVGDLLSDFLKMPSKKNREKILDRLDIRKSSDESQKGEKPIEFAPHRLERKLPLDMREEILPGIKKRYDGIDGQEGRIYERRIKMEGAEYYKIGQLVTQEMGKLDDWASLPTANFDYDPRGFLRLYMCCGSFNYAKVDRVKEVVEKVADCVERDFKLNSFPHNLTFASAQEVPGIHRWIEVSKKEDSVSFGLQIKKEINDKQMVYEMEQKIKEEKNLAPDKVELHFYIDNQMPFVEIYARGIKDEKTAIETMNRINAVGIKVMEVFHISSTKAS